MYSLIPRIYNLFLDAYGPQGWWPVGGSYFPKTHDPFEVTVGAILTQNTAWKNASMAIEALRSKGMLSVQGILDTDTKQLAAVIRSSGYYNQKADRLKRVCRYLYSASGSTPTRGELLGIGGIGPETADSILLYAYGIPVFVIDAYTRRIFSRIGVADARMSYDGLQKLFMSSLDLDEKLFNEYHALIVRHAKDVCGKKPQCGLCMLAQRGLCAHGRIGSG
jgi:endonuclease-3 related protein